MGFLYLYAINSRIIQYVNNLIMGVFHEAGGIRDFVWFCETGSS